MSTLLAFTRRAVKSALTWGTASSPWIVHVVEVPLEEPAELGRLEQVDVEGVLEVGGGVGGEEEHRPVVGQHPGQLPDVAFGVVEVLDQVGGARPAEAAGG